MVMRTHDKARLGVDDECAVGVMVMRAHDKARLGVD